MTVMTMANWAFLTESQMEDLIREHGEGLNVADMIESIPFITAMIKHLYHVKHIERLPRYSIRAAVEHLRWRSFSADNSKKYKIRNALTSDIAHFLHRIFNPEMNDWIQIARLNPVREVEAQ